MSPVPADGVRGGTASPHGGAVHTQPDEATVVESLVALGATHAVGQGAKGGSRVQALGEIAQGIVAEGLAHPPGRAAASRARASMAWKASSRSTWPRSSPHSKAEAGI